jgi:type I restriction enzyme S subunit
MSWPKKPLSEVADYQLGKMLDQVKNRGDSRPYLANKNVRWGTFDFSELREMRFEEAEFERFSLKNGDIVMCEGGVPGRCAIWREEMPQMMYQKALHRIRPLEGMDSVFLYYNLSHRAQSGHFNGLLTGATIKHLPREKLALVDVDVPDLPTQTRIASILSVYDDLIENNRRRIALLEQAARLLYREWFVHFRFPGHETANLVDGLPEEWVAKTYGDLFHFIGGHAFKSSTYAADGRFGIVTIKNVHDALFIAECSSRVIDTPNKMKAHCRLQTGDILLSLTGNVGRACVVVGKNLLLNQRVAKIDGKSSVPKSFVYWTFSNPDTMKELENLAYGVAQLNLSPVQLSGRPFVLPSRAILDMFDTAALPILEQQISLTKQNAQLTRARDLLLPRLMDGRIPV